MLFPIETHLTYDVPGVGGGGSGQKYYFSEILNKNNALNLNIPVYEYMGVPPPPPNTG